jgi:hypothetical protein
MKFDITGFRHTLADMLEAVDEQWLYAYCTMHIIFAACFWDGFFLSLLAVQMGVGLIFAIAISAASNTWIESETA